MISPVALPRYPLYKAACLFIAGILLGKYFLLPASALAGAGCCLFLLEIVLVRNKCAWPASGLVAALVLCLGCLKIRADVSPIPIIADSLSFRTVVVAGTVDDPPTERPDRTRFSIRAASWTDGKQTIPLDMRVLVSVVRPASAQSVCHIVYGMSLLIAGELSRPPAEGNPGEFSPREYYDAIGINGTLLVHGPAQISIRDSIGGSWCMRQMVIPFRNAILRTISETVPGEEGEFLKDLMIGDRSGISPQTRAAFFDSGISHILAVSGMRVLLVWAILAFLYNLARLPGKLRPLFVGLGLLFYMVLTGAHPPVVRATFTGIALLAGECIEHRGHRPNLLALSALVILAFNAHQLFDVGFQLSFVAVLSLLHLLPPLQGWISSLGGAGLAWGTLRRGLHTGAASIIVTLGTLPIIAVHFGKVSLIGLLTNIAIIPATGLCVVLGSASLLSSFFCPDVAAAYGAVNSIVLHWTLRGAALCAVAPYAALDTLRFNSWDAFPYYAGLGLAFSWRNRSAAKRLLIVLLAGLNLVMYLPVKVSEAGVGNSVRLSMIDVGQGDAILLEFPTEQTVLVDAGPRSMSRDAGESIVAPFLKRRGITRIDLLVISHPDADHAGGAPYILRHFPVGRVLRSWGGSRSAVSASCQNAIASAGCTVVTAHAGQIIPLAPDARMYVLWPPDSLLTVERNRPAKNNNTSVVLKVLYGETSFLFTGDAESDAEGRMIDRYGTFLHSTFLKVAHHGSNSSSSARFLEAVSPAVAGVSVGRHNAFRHPSPEVLTRLLASGAVVRRTDREGALILETDGARLRVLAWRSGNP